MFRGVKKRWHESILSGGNYFKGDAIDLEEQIKIFHFTNKFTLRFAHSSIYILFFQNFKVYHFSNYIFQNSLNMLYILYSYSEQD